MARGALHLLKMGNFQLFGQRSKIRNTHIKYRKTYLAKRIWITFHLITNMDPPGGVSPPINCITFKTPVFSSITTCQFWIYIFTHLVSQPTFVWDLGVTCVHTFVRPYLTLFCKLFIIFWSFDQQSFDTLGVVFAPTSVCASHFFTETVHYFFWSFTVS